MFFTRWTELICMVGAARQLWKMIRHPAFCHSFQSQHRNWQEYAMMAQQVMVFCAVCFKRIKVFMQLSLKIKEAYPYFSTMICRSRWARTLMNFQAGKFQFVFGDASAWKMSHFSYEHFSSFATANVFMLQSKVIFRKPHRSLRYWMQMEDMIWHIKKGIVRTNRFQSSKKFGALNPMNSWCEQHGKPLEEVRFDQRKVQLQNLGSYECMSYSIHFTIEFWFCLLFCVVLSIIV